ncbi:MAG: RNA helicase [Bacilli bacterium]|nr:RNA helicase [Bacilli bacterium]
MIKIKIQLDFNNGPIWGNYYDENNQRTMTGVDVIDYNEDIQSLAKRIQEKYSSYYEFNSHDQACWFNEEKEHAEKDEMLELITQLINKIESVNDGSFEIEDHVTDMISEL